MEDELWTEKLHRLAREGTAKEIEDTAAALESDVRRPGKNAASGLGQPELDATSRMLLLELGPASLEGMLGTRDPEAPADRVWFMDRLLENELQVRARVRQRFLHLLDDKEWLPDPDPKIPMERIPPRRRVCDVAYVAMRALTHPEEDQVGFSVETEQFLHMPVELKDHHIEEARTAHQWNLPTPDPDTL